ncbi:RHS repeat-associated core domain-containing protein [Pseudomonas typographi]|uniref:RHS repeat-associated core domain-containing protein n=1 Tax=Pseudomonas typographi TaxID=2715964 RepID=UPI00168773B8
MKPSSQRAWLLGVDRQRSALLGVPATGSRHAYTPYGYSANRAAQPRAAYAGLYREPTAGLYLPGNGCRAYSPTLGCFLHPDAHSPFGQGGLNTYSYCAGDPVNRHDRNGAYFGLLAPLVDSVATAGVWAGVINETALDIVRYSVGSGVVPSTAVRVRRITNIYGASFTSVSNTINAVGAITNGASSAANVAAMASFTGSTLYTSGIWEAVENGRAWIRLARENQINPASVLLATGGELSGVRLATRRGFPRVEPRPVDIELGLQGNPPLTSVRRLSSPPPSPMPPASPGSNRGVEVTQF